MASLEELEAYLRFPKAGKRERKVVPKDLDLVITDTLVICVELNELQLNLLTGRVLPSGFGSSRRAMVSWEQARASGTELGTFAKAPSHWIETRNLYLSLPR